MKIKKLSGPNGSRTHVQKKLTKENFTCLVLFNEVTLPSWGQSGN